MKKSWSKDVNSVWKQWLFVYIVLNIRTQLLRNNSRAAYCFLGKGIKVSQTKRFVQLFPCANIQLCSGEKVSDVFTSLFVLVQSIRISWYEVDYEEIKLNQGVSLLNSIFL